MIDGRKQLSRYLAEPGRSQAAFARAIDCSESHLSLFLRGERGVSPALAQRISRTTGIPVRNLVSAELAKLIDGAAA